MQDSISAYSFSKSILESLENLQLLMTGGRLAGTEFYTKYYFGCIVFLPLLEEHAVWEVWRGFEWVFGCVPRMGTIEKSVLLAIRITFLERLFNVITFLYIGDQRNDDCYAPRVEVRVREIR